MVNPVIVIGDDVEISAQLYKDDQTFTVNPAATVKAMLVKTDHSEALSSAVTLSPSATGADWSTALLIVEMSAAVTTAVTYTGNCLLEIQVDDTIKETWFGVVRIVEGQIA